MPTTMAMFSKHAREQKSLHALLPVEKKAKQKIKNDPPTSYPWTTWILILGNVILIISSLALVTATTQESSRIKSAGDVSLQDVVCLSCTEIGVNNKDSVEHLQGLGIHENGDGSRVCCAKAGRHLELLIDLHADKMYHADKMKQHHLSGYPQCTSTTEGSTNQRTAARVVGLRRTPHGTARNDTLGWDRHSTQSFLHRNITYKDGHFTVLSSGFYYVYMQLSLKEDDSILPPESNNTGALFYLVYRRNAGSLTDEKLLESFEPHCNLQTSECKIPSYVGAVFSLNAHDEIYVMCSNPSQICESQHGNYFGLHMI